MIPSTRGKTSFTGAIDSIPPGFGSRFQGPSAHELPKPWKSPLNPSPRSNIPLVRHTLHGPGSSFGPAQITTRPGTWHMANSVIQSTPDCPSIQKCTPGVDAGPTPFLCGSSKCPELDTGASRSSSLSKAYDMAQNISSRIERNSSLLLFLLTVVAPCPAIQAVCFLFPLPPFLLSRRHFFTSVSAGGQGRELNGRFRNVRWYIDE